MNALLTHLFALPIGLGGLAGLALFASPESNPVSPAPTSQAPQDPAPAERGPDPQDWVEVQEVDGLKVITRRSYYDSGRLRRIHTQLPEVIGPRGHHGRDMHLYENGVVKQDTHWRMGQLQGDYREWFEGGTLKISTQHVGNLRQGLFEEYGEAGTLRVRGHYDGGVLQGEFRLWFAGGFNQELSHWEQGVQTGLYRVWRKDNVPLRSVHYEDGQLHGTAIEYHAVADEERIRMQGDYHRGERQGVWKEFDEEGRQILSSTYDQGTLSGPYEQWKGGVSVLQTQYVEGLEQGERKEFYLSGQPFAAGVMKDGLREGPWRYWEEDGSLQANWSGIYRAGKKVAELEDSDDQ